ncbi:MAG: hypothetical protein H7Z21_00425 [Hymenobacter sp.]|nr:hypothetical protein [Hymenobacter sp.]
MKRLALSVPLLWALLALTPAARAQTTSPKPASQTPSAQTPSAIEQDLRIFSGWVNDKLDRAETGVRRELPRLTSEFDRQSQRLDRGVDSLSAQGKREYADQKKRYQDWATRQDSLNAQARRPETAQQAQNRLLGENVVLTRARATELPDLYGRFIEATRDQRRQWGPANWSQAAAVLAALNARYEQVREQIPLEDRIRIRSWQGEFRTLEAARDVKEIMEK